MTLIVGWWAIPLLITMVIAGYVGFVLLTDPHPNDCGMGLLLVCLAMGASASVWVIYLFVSIMLSGRFL